MAKNGFMKSGFPCATNASLAVEKAAFLQGLTPFRDTMVGFSIHGSIRTGGYVGLHLDRKDGSFPMRLES